MIFLGLCFIGTTSPDYQLELSTNSAGKPTSDAWTVVSDSRTKNKSLERPYTKGLDYLSSLPQPIYFTYNGVAGTPEGDEGVGWNAQDIELVSPELVKRTKGKLTPRKEKVKDKFNNTIELETPQEIIDALPEEDILGLNTGELKYAMINSIKELKDRVEELEAQVEDLKKNKQDKI